jgi:hypothetical protein
VLVLNTCRESGLDILQCTTRYGYFAKRPQQGLVEPQLRTTNGPRLADDFDYCVKLQLQKFYDCAVSNERTGKGAQNK